jgi:hypothetical protein
MVPEALTPWNGKVVGDVIRFIAGSTMAKDDLAKGRRIYRLRDNKFSKNFINGNNKVDIL